MSRCNAQVIRRRRLNRAGLQRKGVLLPIRDDPVHSRGGNGFAGVVTDQAHRKRTQIRGSSLRVEGTLVLSVGMERHAPPADVQHARLVARIGLLDFDLQALRECGAGASRFVDCHLGPRVSAFHEVPIENAAPVTMKRAIPHHLRIQPAVIGVIDLLGHQAIESGADGRDGLIGMNRQRCWCVLSKSSKSRSGDCRDGEDLGKRFLGHAHLSPKGIPGQYIAWIRPRFVDSVVAKIVAKSN